MDFEFQAWIDVGGTFTDCFVRSERQGLKRCKLLSSGLVPVSCDEVLAANIFRSQAAIDDVDGFWIDATLRVLNSAGGVVATRRIVRSANGEIECDEEIASFAHQSFRFELDAGLESPVLAVRRLLACPLNQPLPPLQVRLGTTRGTNALLTRRGAQTALAITAPFEDLLLIGDQTRPSLFELGIRKLPQLAHTVVGVRERLDASGKVLRPLEVEHARAALLKAHEAGCKSLAICLMHSYVNPEHELQLEQVAREVGFTQLSRSSHIAPLIELVARAQTTVVDAYLSPIIREYLARLVRQFGGAHAQLQVMTSAGGLVDWQSYTGKDSILSGPAGGVVALHGLSQSLQIDQLIGLDMGGTSTDVSRIGPDHQLQYESTKAGVRILTPTLPIETVASGGGSVCWFDGVALRVGPQSAGAFPGPACYGRGGPLTITDLNVYLGRLPKQQFPFPLDEAAIAFRLDELLSEMHGKSQIADRQQLADGLRRLANEQMSAAVRTVSTSQGVDPRSASLVGFGGAAGQHICEIAELLGMSQIVDSAEAGLLSALGMGLADVRRDAVLPVYRSLQELDWEEWKRNADQLARELAKELSQLAFTADRIEARMWCELRYRGTDATLTVAWSELSDVADAFHAEHEKRFGYARRGRDIELVSIRVEALGRSVQPIPAERRISNVCELTNDGTIPSYDRAAIGPGQRIAGPAIVLNSGSTLVIDAGWSAESLSGGTLLLTRAATRDIKETRDNKAESESVFDPVVRDCLAQRLSAIATQMGVVLQQTAVSVNVKQRRDFSCAIFDAEGRLLANAPHVPVHLGAMGQTVRGIMQAFPSIGRGDCFITNDPYRGGSHLPDVTVVTPVFADLASSNRPVMFVANRAHHADIGGVAPGSMSVVATKLGEEGVVIAPRYLAEAGEDRTEALREMLLNAIHPPRAIAENLADVAAQQAANARGAALLTELAGSLGWKQLTIYSEHLLDAAAERVAQFIARMPQIDRQFVDRLDDGTAIQVRIAFTERNRLAIDFTGTGPVSATNFNANPSIVTAAVMYVLRCLIADELPLNEGVMRQVELKIPPDCVLNPTAHVNAFLSPAVAAGNVETSQRVVDVLLGAFGVAAASQGTMNNVLFGNTRFGFYETVCGGAGAIDGMDGASGVHTHMTNTRLTDPEVLEARYPVRLIQFGLRTGSGGTGRWKGGDGIVREYEFLEPVDLSLLTSRRGMYRPYGAAGGQPGQGGRNWLIRRSTTEPLPSSCHQQLHAGDRLLLETPGGGGFGSKTTDASSIDDETATNSV